MKRRHPNPFRENPLGFRVIEYLGRYSALAVLCTLKLGYKAARSMKLTLHALIVSACTS